MEMSAPTVSKSPPRAARKGSGGITLNDVAKLAGVSAITVSRALNTPAQVSAETLQRVRDAVSRTGYVPNLLAGGLASNRSRLVAALIPTIAGSVFLETVQALTDTLAGEGYQLMLGQSGYTGAREDALIDAIVGRRPDGIVLTGIMHSAEGRRRLLASGIPVVETWDLTPTPIDMLVGFSHEKVGAQAAAFLHGEGYGRVGIVSADDHRAGLRQAGFETRWRELGGGKVPACKVTAPSTLGNGRAALLDLLAQDPKIDAVFCSSDVLAHGVITEARAQDIEIPGELAVMGFGNLGFAADLHPALTTVHIDGAAIGSQAARFIIERTEGRDPGPKVRDIGFSIVRRASA
jgi:LacI family transcriptional regulator, gluconate utilization system Gnt-I transcriptional repressor